jgi:hypothetical protein
MTDRSKPAFRGQTPDEVFFGTAPNLSAELLERRPVSCGWPRTGARPALAARPLPDRRFHRDYPQAASAVRICSQCSGSQQGPPRGGLGFIKRASVVPIKMPDFTTARWTKDSPRPLEVTGNTSSRSSASRSDRSDTCRIRRRCSRPPGPRLSAGKRRSRRRRNHRWPARGARLEDLLSIADAVRVSANRVPVPSRRPVGRFGSASAAHAPGCA